mgnify:FL=1
MAFRISERFRLELHWSKVVYKTDEIVQLEGCYFSGPALLEIDQVNEKDFITLDFAGQYAILVPDYYVSKLSWAGVKKEENKICVDNAVLINKCVNSVPRLSNNDYIIIDTSNHTTERHQKFLTYQAHLIRYDGEKYDFRSK